MQKLAVIDCGTNTFHLLVVTLDSSAINITDRLQIPVKLGEGGINRQTIAPAAFARGIGALKIFSDRISENKVDKVVAFATSAIRSADNGEEFIRFARNETGVELVTISGLREAELIFKGVSHAFPMSEENILVMDIGGGSVEFIIGNREGINWQASFDIGAARLVEEFHKSDPISPVEVESLNQYLDSKLVELNKAMQQFKASKLVGSAGSFDSICELVNEFYHRNLLGNGEKWCEIPINEYKTIHQALLLSTLDERKNMRGLVDYRVEMMVVASCLVAYVIRKYSLSQLYCSVYSLKEGVVFENLGD